MTRPKISTARRGSLRRKRRIRLRPAAGLALLGVAAAVALGLFAERLRTEREPAPLPLAPPAPPRSQDAPAPSPTRPKPALSRPYKVEGDLTIEDGITFKAENGPLIRLADLTAPSKYAICLDPAGARWACGLQARAALNNIMRRQEVWCQTFVEGGEPRRARCTVDNIDLGRLIVRQGFARPADGPDTPALVAARNEGKGLWNGGWTFVGSNDARDGR